jgi:sugar phosphate isomerase/epimerase
MKIGFCGKPEVYAEAVQAGVDYFECTVVGLMERTLTERRAFAAEVKGKTVSCEVFSILFPGREIPLTGADFNGEAVAAYAASVFETLNMFDASVVVFGSGGARRCPDGFDRGIAMWQLTQVGRILADEAEKHHCIVALEPLNRLESNMINSLDEALELVNLVNHPYFKITADLYHMQMENEPPDKLYACKEALAQTHIATNKNRLYPQAGDKAVLEPYFNVLRDIQYNGRMSIEAGACGSLRDSVDVLREWH